MRKKVRDLTLKELKEICEEHGTCLGCPVHQISLDEILCSGGLCKEIDDIPSHLELDKEIEVDLEV